MSGYSIALSLYGDDPTKLPDHWAKRTIGTPHDSFVISKDNGAVISVYRNADPEKDTWDLRPYSDSGLSAVWNFRSWGNPSINPDLYNEIVEQVRAIQFSRWEIMGLDREPTSCRPTAVRKLAEIAYTIGIDIVQLLNNTKHEHLLFDYYDGLGHSASQKQFTLIIWEIILTSDVGPLSQYDLAIEALTSLKNRLDKRAFGKSEETLRRNQHLCIPSRIYSAIIREMHAKLQKFEAVADDLVALYRERNLPNALRSWKASYFGVSEDKAKANKNAITWDEAIAKHNLTLFCNENNIHNWFDLKRQIMHHLRLCRIWITMMSGMRKGEAARLPSNTFQKIRVEGGSACVLKGYTSKTIGGKTIDPTNWITTEITKPAVDSAQKMSRIACMEGGLSEELVGTADFPLFPSWEKPVNKKRNRTYEYESAATIKADNDSVFEWLRSLNSTVVTAEDIKELKEINQLSDLEYHKIILNEPWHFKTHQFRKSLAVYSAASGKVSLGALKYQFQHLTQEMTLYYQHGGIFAKNLLTGDDVETKSLLSLVAEIAEERVKKQVKLWDEFVINAEEPLIGGEGNRLQTSKDKGMPILIATDRDEVEKMIRAGRIALKEGPIMWCTNPEPCDKTGLQLLPECPECAKSLGSPTVTSKKMETAIIGLERSRDQFPDDSPFYKQMDGEVKAARRSQEKILAKMEATYATA